VETTEKIVEAYVRYTKGWLTIANIKCEGQLEIDLLAVDVSKPGVIDRYHIESGVSISGSYSALTTKAFSEADLKTRNKMAGQRRTLGYFTEKKFGSPAVIQKLRDYGFEPGNYKKVIVTWEWNRELPVAAKAAGVDLWDFQHILREIQAKTQTGRTYFTDDTMRTLQLMAMATAKVAPIRAEESGGVRGRPRSGAPTRSRLIDEMLAKGVYTVPQIVDAVMKDGTLKVPRADTAKVRSLVSVRTNMARKAGGTYSRDKSTQVVKVVFTKKNHD
jgi:hypothetical protein